MKWNCKMINVAQLIFLFIYCCYRDISIYIPIAHRGLTCVLIIRNVMSVTRWQFIQIAYYQAQYTLNVHTVEYRWNVKHTHVSGRLCKLFALTAFTYVHTFQWVIKHAVAWVNIINHTKLGAFYTEFAFEYVIAY